MPGSQFPVEAYDELHEADRAALDSAPTTRSSPPTPRWSTKSVRACCCSTARPGGFGFTVAQARPDKMKAIVAVEPAVARRQSAEPAALKNIPTLVVYGDYTFRSTAAGRKCAQIGVDYAEADPLPRVAM